MRNNKSLKKITSLFLAFVALVSMFSIPVLAEGTVETILTSNSSSVPTQGTVTVSIKLNISDPNGVAAIDNLQLNYNASAFDYTEGDLPNKNFRTTPANGNVKVNYNSGRTDLDSYSGELIMKFTFRAKASAKKGPYKFNVSGYNFFSNVNGEFIPTDVKVATDLTLNVSEGQSNNANLESLSIDGFDMSPEFSKSEFEYTVGVPTDTKSVEINAVPEDNNATIVISGNTNLSKDVNPVSVIVTAQDGNSQIYKITVKTGVTTADAAKDGDVDYKAKVEELELTLKETNLRNLIIVLVLVFIIICLIVYLLIEKFGDKWFHRENKDGDNELLDDFEQDEDEFNDDEYDQDNDMTIGKAKSKNDFDINDLNNKK